MGGERQIHRARDSDFLIYNFLWQGLPATVLHVLHYLIIYYCSHNPNLIQT